MKKYLIYLLPLSVFGLLFGVCKPSSADVFTYGYSAQFIAPCIDAKEQIGNPRVGSCSDLPVANQSVAGLFSGTFSWDTTFNSNAGGVVAGTVNSNFVVQSGGFSNSAGTSIPLIGIPTFNDSNGVSNSITDGGRSTINFFRGLGGPDNNWFNASFDGNLNNLGNTNSLTILTLNSGFLCWSGANSGANNNNCGNSAGPDGQSALYGGIGTLAIPYHLSAILLAPLAGIIKLRKRYSKIPQS